MSLMIFLRLEIENQSTIFFYYRNSQRNRSNFCHSVLRYQCRKKVYLFTISTRLLFASKIVQYQIEKNKKNLKNQQGFLVGPLIQAKKCSKISREAVPLNVLCKWEYYMVRVQYSRQMCNNGENPPPTTPIICVCTFRPFSLGFPTYD